ncbi:MAG: hypothetical protein ISR78_09595 [Spirochaetia bacterium]|nr:hypothetical protein [Spirochaetia bacterium]
MMKKFYLLGILLLIGTSLFAASPQDVEKTNFKVKITEFGYPLIPHASQLKVYFPLSLDYGINKTAEFEVNIWYRAISPYFNPNIFYEVGK